MQLRLSGHETFYPRERWLHKGLNEGNFYHSANFMKEEETGPEYPTDYMGVGFNMVKSIRYWISAFGLILKNGTRNTVSPFADQLLKFDPFLDKKQTMWILHYNLIVNESGPTVWKWFFSHSDLFSFRKDNFISACRIWLDSNFQKSFSDRSLENDFSVMTSMYCSEEKKDLFYPSPFLSCEILKFNPHLKRYSRNKDLKIDIHIILYCMLLFRNRYFRDAGVLDLDHLRQIPESPLRVFALETDRIFELSEDISPKIAKKISFSRTAGIKTVSFSNLDETELLNEIYRQERVLSYI